MRMLNLALKDIRQLLNDWKTVAFMVVMPIAFTLLFGFIFGGLGSEDVDHRLPVGLLDQDNGSFSASLIEILGYSAAIRMI